MATPNIFVSESDLANLRDNYSFLAEFPVEIDDAMILYSKLDRPGVLPQHVDAFVTRWCQNHGLSEAHFRAYIAWYEYRAWRNATITLYYAEREYMRGIDCFGYRMYGEKLPKDVIPCGTVIWDRRNEKLHILIKAPVVSEKQKENLQRFLLQILIDYGKFREVKLEEILNVTGQTIISKVI